ncbi:MAG: hypothetical protein FVQ81_13410 [Candidatus Glassbacteria bacterium]|nr:hypothetical protein [Candidatus Glassbacteria bacterium]
MPMTLQVIIAVALSIIAIYFLVLTALTIVAYLKIRALQRYVNSVVRDRLDQSLEHLKNISERVEEVADSTAGKVEDLTGILPELRDKLEELIDLLDLVQEKLRSPLLNIVSAVKIFSDKVHRWM